MSKESATALATGTPVAPAESTPSPAVVGTQIDSDRFAKLAARETQIQKDREAFKSEQQKVYEEKEKLKAIQKQITDFEEMRSKDPLAALKHLGFTDTDIFNALSTDKPAPTPEELARAATQDEIKKFQQAQEQVAAKVQAEKDTKAISEYKDQIGKFIEKEAEKLEYCKHYGPVAEDLIYETVLQFIKEDPALTPFAALKEAAEAVESLYEEEDVSLMGLKKRQAKIPKAPEPAPAVKPHRGAPQSKPLPTITNKASATVASAAPKSESREQKRTRLENLLRNGG